MRSGKGVGWTNFEARKGFGGSDRFPALRAEAKLCVLLLLFTFSGLQNAVGFFHGVLVCRVDSSRDISRVEPETGSAPGW